MKCDRCNNEATVHEVTIKAGVKVERHLCEACAKGEGFAVQAHQSIGQLLSQYIATQSAGPALSTASGAACGRCGATYAEFRQTGLLGCPNCYRAFEGQLSPLLQRAHEGGTHHVGKTPRRAGGAKAARVPEPGAPRAEERERAKRVRALKKQIAEAVAAEQYERAATLRDALRALGEPGTAHPGPSAVGGATPQPSSSPDDPEGSRAGE